MRASSAAPGNACGPPLTNIADGAACFETCYPGRNWSWSRPVVARPDFPRHRTLASVAIRRHSSLGDDKIRANVQIRRCGVFPILLSPIDPNNRTATRNIRPRTGWKSPCGRRRGDRPEFWANRSVRISSWFSPAVPRSRRKRYRRFRKRRACVASLGRRSHTRQRSIHRRPVFRQGSL